MPSIFYNGEIMDRENVKIDIEDRGYQFGDGIYEVIRIYNGQPYAFKEHIERLYDSARKIFLDIPYTKAELSNRLLYFIEKEQPEVCNLYIQISRGVSMRNHLIPAKMESNLVAYFLNGKRPIALIENGITALLVEDTRWLHCDIKSISLLGNVLAKHKAVSAGYTEAILHRGETITEGSSTNVFIVKDQIIKTHPANELILNGITRKKIIALSKEQLIAVKEVGFSLTELREADEVFITSTTMEITPVINVNSLIIGDGKPGPITRKLQKLLTLDIEKECRLLSSL